MGVNDAREQLEVAKAEAVKLERLVAEVASRAGAFEVMYREVEDERDALAAIIEQAKAAYNEFSYKEYAADSVYKILASADTDTALREVHAQAWEEGYDAGVDGVGHGLPIGGRKNPYREES